MPISSSEKPPLKSPFPPEDSSYYIPPFGGYQHTIAMEKQRFDLFQLLQEDKRRGFEVIFRTYYPRMHLCATGIIHDRQQAEDMVSDVFSRLWQSNTFFTTRQELEAYLFISTKNACYNYLRHNSKFKVDHLDQEDAAEIPDHEAFDIYDNADLHEQALQAIDELSPAVRTVMLLRYKCDMKPKEISMQLGIALATVRTQLRDGMKQLRDSLGGNTLFLLIYTILDNII